MHESRSSLARVVETVAAFEEVSPEDLPPLADTVSEETLTRLTTEWATQPQSVEVTYLGYHITVSPTGEITVRLPES